MAVASGQYMPDYPPPPPTQRRGSSNADRYRPSDYPVPPPQQQDPNLLGPHQQPYASGNGPQPPYPVDPSSTMGGPSGMPPIPQDRPLANTPAPHGPGYSEPPRRPSYSGSHMSRRSRAESTSSRRSYDSRASRHSKRSHIDADPNGHDHSDGHHHHHHHNHHHYQESRQSRRQKGESVRPSLGDTIFTVFKPLKYLFEPREKV